METEEKRFAQDITGKKAVTEKGTLLGVVIDMVFAVTSGEIIYFVLENTTAYAERLELEKSKEGKTLLPCSAVSAIGDFVVVREEDIV